MIMRNSFEAFLFEVKKLHNLNKISDALLLAKQLVDSQPNHAEALFWYGSLLIRSNDLINGIGFLRRSLDFAPNNPNTINNLSKALIDLGNYDEAEILLQKSYEHNQNNIMILSTLGYLYTEKELFSEAINFFMNVIKINPDYHRAYFNLGNLFSRTKKFDKAIECFAKTIDLKGDYIEAYWNKSMAELTLGNFEIGWELFESRIKLNETKYEHEFYEEKKSWRGGEINGKTLLIYGEQGYGDVIQFSRFLPMLKDFNCDIVFYISDNLVSLLNLIDSDIKIVSKKRPIPRHDFHCPVMSLPYVFKLSLNSIPSKFPYIHIPYKKVSEFKTYLRKSTKKRIGVAFSGSSKHKKDKSRSIELNQFKKIFQSQFDFYSLQIEYRDSDYKALKDSKLINDHKEAVNDFLDTAAIILNMDLIITIDTVIAHLAGALNKSVWIILPFNSDFRWLAEGSKSPWYPSARIFRQTEHNNWLPILSEVKNELKNYQVKVLT